MTWIVAFPELMLNVENNRMYARLKTIEATEEFIQCLAGLWPDCAFVSDHAIYVPQPAHSSAIVEAFVVQYKHDVQGPKG